MAKKQTDEVAGAKRPKIKRSYYLDRDLWERLQAFANSQEPVVTDSAVIDTALRHYLDAREKRKGK